MFLLGDEKSGFILQKKKKIRQKIGQVRVDMIFKSKPSALFSLLFDVEFKTSIKQEVRNFQIKTNHLFYLIIYFKEKVEHFSIMYSIL